MDFIRDTWFTRHVMKGQQCHWQLEGEGQKMLLNTLQCTGHSPAIENHLAQKSINARVEKPCSKPKLPKKYIMG